VSNTKPSDTRAFLVTACLGSLVFLAVSFAPGVTVHKYRWSFASLIPVLWIVFALRGVFFIRPLHYALFALALLFHDLGAFGGYSWYPLGLEFDWCVHFTFGLVGALMFARWLDARVGVRGGALYLLAVLCVGGMSALHEIMEAGTSMYLGEYGMQYVGPDNPFDSQTDMLSGILGATVAAVSVGIASRRRQKASEQRA
jgi:uncharacterized membrane protein YjdF